MLIYPDINNDFKDCLYSIQGNIIHVNTLNLNIDWVNIEKRLKEIARKSFPSLPG
jgi:desulfoferrodoxin (superoxide reductase-like protein)